MTWISVDLCMRSTIREAYTLSHAKLVFILISHVRPVRVQHKELFTREILLFFGFIRFFMSFLFVWKWVISDYWALFQLNSIDHHWAFSQLQT